MIATSSGEIITNNHVVEGASTINVVIENHGTHKRQLSALTRQLTWQSCK